MPQKKSYPRLVPMISRTPVEDDQIPVIGLGVSDEVWAEIDYDDLMLLVRQNDLDKIGAEINTDGLKMKPKKIVFLRGHHDREVVGKADLVKLKVTFHIGFSGKNLNKPDESEFKCEFPLHDILLMTEKYFTFAEEWKNKLKMLTGI